MRVLVFSDSHMDLDGMKIVMRRESAEGIDRIFHLGDHDRDAAALHALFPGIPMEIVRGNNDYSGVYPADKTVRIADKVFFLTHGDRYGVKYGKERITDRGLQEQADVTLFGHTHQPFLFQKGGMWIMNPGSIGHPMAGAPKTYGVIRIENASLYCEIREM